MRFRILVILFLTGNLWAQHDSTIVMDYAEFMNRVKMHHPLARQAELRVSMGEAYLVKSKGAFDPKLNGDINQKYFKDEQYYSIISAGLKVPTWYGISFQGGYDRNSGTQLNPERTLPDEGLWYAGINVSLGRGLIIDQRRAEYKKARIYLNSSLQQQRILLNELYINAGLAYWDWFKSYNKMRVYEEAVENAFDRFKAVKESAELGDRPMVDTLEASIQLQNRLFNFLGAELEYLNNTSLVEIYLWDNGYVPLEIDSATHPPVAKTIAPTPINPGILLKVDSLKNRHPDLLNAQYKIDQKNVDLKLRRENLKPEFNFKYNAITQPVNTDIFSGYSMNNYTWGADLSFPLFLRKERAQLQLTKLEIENLQSDLTFKTEQIRYKIEITMNTWKTTFDQVQLWQKTTLNYANLLESERILFAIGESSLFMVNSREIAYIQAQLDLIDKVTDNKKAVLKALFATGTLFNSAQQL